jgi:FtsP/CotA-like multicopper oxidase with cupredoxin domain
MHLNGMDFQVIEKDGYPLEVPQTMNTVLIGPGETYDIAFTVDAVGTWTFHCHILDHMMIKGGPKVSFRPWAVLFHLLKLTAHTH